MEASQAPSHNPLVIVEGPTVFSSHRTPSWYRKLQIAPFIGIRNGRGSPNWQCIPTARAMLYIPSTRTFIAPCHRKAGVAPRAFFVDRLTGASSGHAWPSVDELTRSPFLYTVQSTGRPAGAKICGPQQERKRNTNSEDEQGSEHGIPPVMFSGEVDRIIHYPCRVPRREATVHDAGSCQKGHRSEVTMRPSRSANPRLVISLLPGEVDQALQILHTWTSLTWG